jgi:chromosome segregation ATPase
MSASATAPRLPTVEEVNRDVEAALPHLPCHSVCCGRQWDVRDYVMGAGHTVSITGIVTSLATGNPYFAIGFGVTEVVICVAHGLVRKYGDLSVIVQRFRDATTAYSQAVERQAAAIEGYGTEVGRLTSDVDRLTRENLELARVREDLDRTLRDVRASLESQTAACASLRETNVQLQSRVDQLNAIVAQFKERLAKFSEENVSFHEGLKRLSDDIPLLDQIDDDITDATRRLDDEFDEDLATFGKQILQAQAQSKQIYQILIAQNEALATQVAHLKSAVAQIDQFDDDLEARVSHLETLDRQVEDTRKELTALRSEFETVAAQLVKERLAITAEKDSLLELRESMGREREALERLRSEFAPVASSLASTREGVQAALDRLAVTNRQAEEELRRISNL